MDIGGWLREPGPRRYEAAFRENCAVPISRSTDSRLPSKPFIVPLTIPASPQKH